MQKPKELRRILFELESAAEVLAGPGSEMRRIEITTGPKHVLIVEDDGRKAYFNEEQMVDALSAACHQFDIPVPRNGHKRIIVDRSVGHVILQISIDMAF